MSLQVWLPFVDGTLKQQGLKTLNLSSNNTTVQNNGKLGKCLSFNGSSSLIASSNNVGISGDTAYSIAFWMYWAGDTWTNDYVGIVGWGNMNTNQGAYAIIHNGLPDLDFWNKRYQASNQLQVKKWYHIVMTKEPGPMNTTSKIYVDGKEVAGSATDSTTPSIVDGTLLIGRLNVSTTRWFNGYLNDVRIYNHCLSEKEVKELAKGLVLHYPLNRQGWGQENLVLNSNTFAVGSGATGITPSTTAEGYHQVIAASGNSNWHASWATSTATSLLENTFAEGDPFTISFTIKSENANVTRPPNIYVKSGMGYYAMKGKVTSEWSTVYYSGTWKDTNAIAFHLGFSGLVGTYLFKNWKVEKGSIPTPWCPNSADTLADTMGLNGTIEYDTSGFNNNGTRIGTFGWTSNTPKYEVSQVFNGTDNAIQTPNLTTMITDKNYTIACWTYKTVIGTKNYQTIYGGPSGFELEARSSSSTSPLYRIHNWGGGTTAYNFGEWTHFCFVHTDSDSKLYVNGELKITGTSVNIPSGNYFVGAWNTSTSQNYEGLMSDFRIYATALSADDVKSLYQNEAAFDDQGNLLGPIR